MAGEAAHYAHQATAAVQTMQLVSPFHRSSPLACLGRCPRSLPMHGHCLTVATDPTGSPRPLLHLGQLRVSGRGPQTRRLCGPSIPDDTGRRCPLVLVSCHWRSVQARAECIDRGLVRRRADTHHHAFSPQGDDRGPRGGGERDPASGAARSSAPSMI